MSSRVVSRKSVHAEIEKYKEVIKVLYIKSMVKNQTVAKNTKAVKETKEKLKKVVEEEEEEENYDHDEYERRLDEYLDRDYDY
jgi:hypothetical protein